MKEKKLGIMTELERTCTKCGEPKLLIEFARDTRREGRCLTRCKKCIVEKSQEWAKHNKEKICANTARWRERNPERVLEYARKYLTEHPDYVRLWTKNNPEKSREKTRRWILNNPERVKELRRNHDAKRRAMVSVRLAESMSGHINYSIRRGSKRKRKWESLVGYDIVILKSHLEKLFKGGMTWENYGPYWHIDHIIPVSAFNFETPENIDFKRCWALENLQPLEAVENFKKGNKVEIPFQPALAMNA